MLTKYTQKMTGVYNPIQPRRGTCAPPTRPKPTTPMSTRPKPIDSACPWCAFAVSGSGCTASISDRIKRLNMQLPSTSPMAMLGSVASAVEPMPVKSSGRLVVAASRTTPIQLRPSPDFSPRMSP